MIIELSKILTKVPSALVSIDNLSMEFYSATGWVIIEGYIVVNSEGEKVTLTAVTIPVQLSKEDIKNLFSVTNNSLPSKRRRVLKK
jgi:heptaprenylglyceryl phosphate synthase